RREPPLVEPNVGPAAIDVHGRDRVFERGIGAALEAVRAADRLDARRYRGTCGVGRGWAPDAGGTRVTGTRTHGWYTVFHGWDRCNRRLVHPLPAFSQTEVAPPRHPLPRHQSSEPSRTCDQRPAAAKKAPGR